MGFVRVLIEKCKGFARIGNEGVEEKSLFIRQSVNAVRNGVLKKRQHPSLNCDKRRHIRLLKLDNGQLR